LNLFWEGVYSVAQGGYTKLLDGNDKHNSSFIDDEEADNHRLYWYKYRNPQRSRIVRNDNHIEKERGCLFFCGTPSLFFLTSGNATLTIYSEIMVECSSLH
jgi:hypothetical protein